MAVAIVSGHGGSGSGTTSPVAATITGAASGNMLIAWITSRNTLTVSSITCTNVAWTQIKHTGGGATSTDMYYGVVSGGTSGTSVSVTLSGTPTNGACVRVEEFSGTLVTGTIQGATAVSNNATSTSPSTGAFTNKQADSLLVANLGYGSTTVPSVNPGGIWTDVTRVTQTACCCAGEYAPGPGVASQTTTWTIGSSGDIWATNIGEILSNTITLSVSDSVTTTESVSVSIISTGTDTISVSDSVTTTENTSLAILTNLSVSDSVTSSENVNLIVDSFVNVSDSVTTSENTNITSIDVVSVSDSVTTSESVALSIQTNLSVSDSVTTSENVQASILSTFGISVSDSVSVSESVSLTINTNIFAIDAITTSEFVNPAITPLFLSVTDSVSTSESVSINKFIPGTAAAEQHVKMGYFGGAQISMGVN